MRVLMVCLGNICRSPLAEGILKAKRPDWKVDSAGTSNYHIGKPPHPGSVEIARKFGIDISDQRARQFTAADYSNFDLILTMDQQNYNDVARLAMEEGEKDKVKLILNLSDPAMNRAVPDPYHTGRFEEVYQLLDEALENLL